MRHKLLVLTVKKILQSVYSYRSYCKIKTGVPFFWTTRYISTITHTCVPNKHAKFDLTIFTPYWIITF